MSTFPHTSPLPWPTTAQTVTLDGAHSKLHYVSDVGGAVTCVRNDGTAPVTTPADENYPVFPSPADWECIPSSPTNVSVTTVKLISPPGLPVVHICQCDCD
jgi:hypothetical protein